MPGNFYSQAPADELRRVKAELSRERALCAGLAAALNRIDCFVVNFREPWGAWKTAWWESEVSDYAAFSADNALMHVANVARSALSELEKSK